MGRKNKSSEKKKRKYFKKFLSNKFIPKYYISIKSQKNVPKSYPTSVNRQKNPKKKNSLFVPPMLSKMKKSIHTFYQIFFSNLSTFNSYCQKILKKAYLHQIKQICKKKRSKKSFKKFLVQHCTCTQSKKKIYHLNSNSF